MFELFSAVTIFRVTVHGKGSRAAFNQLEYMPVMRSVLERLAADEGSQSPYTCMKAASTIKSMLRRC